MKQNKLFMAFSCTVAVCGFGQKAYFQQEVNYFIDVKLNDSLHTLSAKENIQYINNSPDTLRFIYFHLWPNAYKNNETALAEQLLRQGKTNLYYSREEERGFIDSLDFRINGEKAKWDYDSLHIDICKLTLNKPLAPKDSITISTPFYLKIPDAKFSRLGHSGQAYYITQWYPKPAVYDREGWHHMPYLDIGEFYSEFGSFDVRISLPQNYLLAATGDRVEAEAEENFLNAKVIETMERIRSSESRKDDMKFPPSSKQFKTVWFRQHNVHDFAWFADKRYNVLHDQIELPGSKKPVDTWVFFTNGNFDLWKYAILYVNDATSFYSKFVGDYPYNHVTAVDGTIMAGGGMEYPNITVIGNMSNAFLLDITITHEVGHNWFYGILGSNERDHPFMDEGFNSFYEMRYTRAKYPEAKITEYLGRDSSFKLFGLRKLPAWREKELLYYISQRSGTDQPMDLHSAEYTEFNYGSIIYSKTPVVLDYLMDMTGEDAFDRAMNTYFENFKFKHPSPLDFFTTFTESSGADISGAIAHLFTNTSKIDFKIKRVRKIKDGNYLVTVKNKTRLPLQFNLYGFKEGKPVGFVSMSGMNKKRTVEFPGKKVDYFKIDGLDRMPDMNRKNNIMRSSGVLRRVKPLQFNFITALEDPYKTLVGYMPIAGINHYNGFMAGLSLHNYGLYRKKFEYHIAPMYAFGTKNITGGGEFSYNIFPHRMFSKISPGIKLKTYAYDQVRNPVRDGGAEDFLVLDYYRIQPYLEFEIKKKKEISQISQFLTASSTILLTDSADYGLPGNYDLRNPTKKQTGSAINRLNYHLNNSRTINPYSVNVELQQFTAGAGKISAVLKYKFNLTKKHDMSLRVFAGTFLWGGLEAKSYYAFRASGQTGSQDYAFDGAFFARNERSGFGFSQFLDRDGNLKIWTPLGYSSEWMGAVNLISPKILGLPLRVFADAVVCDGRFLANDKILWDTGVNIVLWRDIIEVYVPLIYNNDIKNTLDLNNINWLNRIRFTFNIHKLAPKNLVQNALL